MRAMLVTVSATVAALALFACEKKQPAPAAPKPAVAAPVAPAAPAAPAPTAAPAPAAAPAKAVKPIPDGFHTVTVALTFNGAADAIEWYKKAFGATEIMRMMGLDGKSIMHAEIKIGDSIVFLGDAMPGQSVAFPKGKERPTASIHLYVADVDAAYKRAVDAGAKSLMGPPKDMFWGDRYAHLIDPYGHHWGIATHKEDVSEAEMRKRGQAWMKEMAAKKAKQ